MPPVRPFHGRKLTSRRGPLTSLVAFIVLSGALIGMAPASEVVVIYDVVYGDHEGEPLLLDVYRTQDATKRPVLIAVHGGSWRKRSKSSWANLAPRYAKHGYVVFAINYSLAPPGGDETFPAPVNDVSLALQWAQDHAYEYGGDPNRIGVVGSSAGGHLGLMAGASGGVSPDAIAVFSPPTELRSLRRDGVLVGSIEKFLGCEPKECPETYRQASPVYQVDPWSPPTFLAYSTDEMIPLRQPRLLKRQLNEQGVPSTYVKNEGTAHGQGVARLVMTQTLEFFDQHL